MRVYHIFLSIVALSCSVMMLAAQSSRPGAWRVEHLTGAHRLSIESLRTLVVPAQMGDQLSAAVEDLRDVFAQRYGVELVMQVASGERPKYAIYLRNSGHIKSRLQNDAFLIHRQGTRVFISGDGELGALNGVYALCEQVLGARWYWAENIGLEFVGPQRDKFPEGHWHEEPAYVMRQFYPMNGDFGRRNRLVRHFKFNHALAKVFTPELYNIEPEVFSEVYGRRRAPRGHGGYDPQPDFTESRAIEIAAQAALTAFEANPEARSFSLSINDNCLFDDSEATRSALEPINYFRGKPNYTDLVFGFMNAVAARVFDQAGAWTTPSGESRYLTALAYYWTEQSPSFPIHPRVMPVLTADRAQWHDPAYRAEDQALIRRWADSGAERIATWDYYFGAPYIYPRQFSEWIAQSVSFMAENGVSVFFSQLPSSWGLDGCKAWLTAQLLWNPEQDAAVLIEEYYANFFGAAAEPIRAFYEAAERHRNLNEGTPEWIKFYEDEFSIELFDTEILQVLRASIESAKELVANDARRLARVEIVSDAFSLTEAYAAQHASGTRLVANALDVFIDAGDAAALPQQLLHYLQMRAAFTALSERLLDQPMHARLKSFVKYAKLDPVAFVVTAMAHAGVTMPAAELHEYADVMEVAEWWATDEKALCSELENFELQHAATEPQPRNFLGPDLPKVPGWHFDFRPTERLAIEAVDDGAGVRVSGADVFSIFRDVPVVSGQRDLLDASIAYRISPDNRSQIWLSWSDREGRQIERKLLFRCPTGDSSGVRRIVLPTRVPDEAYTLRVRFYMSRQYEGDFFEVHQANFGLIAK